MDHYLDAGVVRSNVAIGYFARRLSAVVGTKSVPYGDIFEELVGGMFDFHWDEETEAFHDYGEHVSDGGIVNEVIVRCQKGATHRHRYKHALHHARLHVCACVDIFQRWVFMSQVQLIGLIKGTSFISSRVFVVL